MENVLTIALIALVIAGAWAVAELALTIKKTRKTLDEVNKVIESANNTVKDLTVTVTSTVDEIKPVIGELKTTINNLQPTLREVPGLVNKVGTAVDALSLDLLRVDQIIADLSKITDTAAHASSSLSSISVNATKTANGILDKVKEHFGVTETSASSGTAQTQAPVARPQQGTQDGYYTVQPRTTEVDTGYFSQSAPAGSKE